MPRPVTVSADAVRKARSRSGGRLSHPELPLLLECQLSSAALRSSIVLYPLTPGSREILRASSVADRVFAEKLGISGLSRMLRAAEALPVALTAEETSGHCRPESAPDFFPAFSSAIAASVSDIIPVLRFLKRLPVLPRLLRERPHELHDAFAAVGLHAELPPADYEDQILVVPGLGEILRAEPEAVLEAVLGDKDH